MDSKQLRHGNVARFVAALLALSMLHAPGHSAADQAAPPAQEPIQVLITWQATPPRAHELSVRLPRATIVRWRALLPRPVPIELKQAKTQWRFRWRDPLARGALSLAVAGNGTDHIEVEIDGKSLRTTIQELAEGPASIQWAEGQLQLQRPASDVVRVQPLRGGVILAPNEEAAIQFEIYLLPTKREHIPTSFRLGLTRFGREPTVYPVDASYRVTAGRPARSRFTLSMRAPGEPGLYELVVRVRPEGVAEIQRRIPIVVLGTERLARRSSEQLDWPDWLDHAQPIQGAHFANGRWRALGPWWLGVGRLRELLRGGVRPAAGSKSSTRWTVQLPSNDAPYLLRVAATGSPGNVGLFVDVERDIESLAVPLEPLRVGLWLDEGYGSQAAKAQSSVLVWPGAGKLTVTVRSTGEQSGLRRAEWQLLRLPSPEQLRLREPRLADVTRDRVGLLLLPNLPALYHFATSPQERPAHWPLLLSAVTNLSTYVSAVRYDGVALPVCGNGLVLWPSGVAQSAYNWDPNQMPGIAQDPGPKDLPELLFRACAQRSLLFVPVFRFDALLRGGERSRRRPLNPLRDADRALMVKLVEEFVARYKHHANFQAIALVVSPQARTALRDLDDGADEDVVRAFLKHAKLSPPKEADAAKLRAWVLQRHAERFTAWRSQRLLELYTALLSTVRKAKKTALCYLIVDFHDRPWTDALRGMSHRGNDVATGLRRAGLELAAWKLPEGLVLVRAYFNSEHSATTLWINRARELDRLFAHHPHAGLYAAETLSTAPPASAPVVLLQTHDRQALGATRALANLEPRALFAMPGVPLAPDHIAHEDLPKILRLLPPGKLQRTWTKGPLRINRWRTSNVAVWLVANVASHPIQCRLQFTAPGQVRTMVRPADVAVEQYEEGREYRFQLDAHALLLLRSPDSTDLLKLTVTLPDAVESALRQRFQQMTRAVAFLRSESRARTPNLILDGVFEQLDGMATRWEVFPPEAASYQPDAAHSGKLGLQLQPVSNDGAYALSWPFTIPPGSELTVRLFARKLDEHAELLLWLVPTDHPNRSAPAFKVPLTNHWQRHTIELSQGEGEQEIWSWRLVLHVRGGKVQIDDVEARARTLSAEERNAMIKSLAPALRAWYDRRLADFSAITAEYWPQYLLRRFSPRRGEQTPSDAEKPPDAPPMPQRSP